jgi:hypothetical protein
MKGYSVSVTNPRAMLVIQSNERNFLTTLLNVTEYTATISGATLVRLKGRLYTCFHVNHDDMHLHFL